MSLDDLGFLLHHFLDTLSLVVGISQLGFSISLEPSSIEDNGSRRTFAYCSSSGRWKQMRSGHGDVEDIKENMAVRETER